MHPVKVVIILGSTIAPFQLICEQHVKFESHKVYLTLFIIILWVKIYKRYAFIEASYGIFKN